jgi:hypothetical protein
MPIKGRGLSASSPLRNIFTGRDRALCIMPIGGNNNVVDGTDAGSVTANEAKTLLAGSTVAGRLYVPGAITLLVSFWTTVGQTVRQVMTTGTVTIAGRNQFGEERTEVLVVDGLDTIRTSNAFASVTSVVLSNMAPTNALIEVSTRTDVNAVAGTEALARAGAPFKLKLASDFLGYSGMGLGAGAPVNLASNYDADFHTFLLTDVGVTIPQAGYVLLKDGAAIEL